MISDTVAEKIKTSSLEEAESELEEILRKKKKLNAELSLLETDEFYWREIKYHFIDEDRRNKKFVPEAR